VEVRTLAIAYDTPFFETNALSAQASLRRRGGGAVISWSYESRAGPLGYRAAQVGGDASGSKC